MKCIQAIWEEDGPPLTTFVLRKKDISVLLELHTKNPRSQWWMVDFRRERLVACDAFRAMIADCGDNGPDFDPMPAPDADYVMHLPTSVIKDAIKGKKVPKGEDGGWSHKETTAVCLVFYGGDIHVKTIETDNKKWDFFDGDELYEWDPVFAEKVPPPAEVGAAVPQMAPLDELLNRSPGATEYVPAAVMAFNAAWLSTLGHLDKVALKNPTTMTIPQNKFDATVFRVESGDGDCSWTYMIMPRRMD